MSPLGALLVGLLVGVLAGAAVAALVLRARRTPAPAGPDGTSPVPARPDGGAVRELFEVMDPAVVLVGRDDAVLVANRAARSMGIVRDTRLRVPALLELVQVTRVRGARRADVRLPVELGGPGPGLVGVQALRLRDGAAVALVLLDATEAYRVEAVRRDFVANVGHELKTPVGALSLLAEAMLGAADDPEAVQRFAARMAHEADRLGRLVRELIDLSRLQGGEPLPDLEPVDVDTVLVEALDRTRMAAAAKGIEIAVGGEDGLVVRGVEAQLTTAVTNLLANAVAYSPEGTRIALAARARGGSAEIAVTDSGIGIPKQDRARVFERFYRVDQSRASSTGGTGLGLAIVKHVASNHGGSVTVWSEEGLGSTFTLRIPLADRGAPDAGARTGSGPVPERGRA